jgi:PPK2 family polyphosphate:nucleotide phosphotransferase
VIDDIRVNPGTRARIVDRDPRHTLGFADKEAGTTRLRELTERLSSLQERLFAESRRSLVLVLQGLDASGKDGVIRTVLTGVNPQGVSVVSFRAPTSTELAHDYLWRLHAALPPRGALVVFNRSHYEDVVAVRLHRLADESVWSRRPAHINDWERMLADEGTTMVKVFLNVSKDEQRDRLQERVDDPAKRWKFRKADLDVRERYDEYVTAWEDVIAETSTDWAPWHIVPADRNWVKSVAVAELLVEALERIDPELPEPEPGIEGLKIS